MDEKLTRLTKSTLVDLTANIIELLTFRSGDTRSPYGQGWNDSRRAICILCGIDKLIGDEEGQIQ